MRKNGSRLISFGQYRATDLFMFAIILVLAELLEFVALKWFGNAATFSFSFALVLVLTIMIRWGWPSLFFATASGIIYCALNLLSWQFYLSYGIGNIAVVLALLYLMLVGKNKVTEHWYLSVLLVVVGWVLQVLARSALLAATGAAGFGQAFVYMIAYSDTGFLSLAVSIIAVLIIRRFDGIFEDQRHYLERIGKLREEAKRRDTFGDELTELDEESLSIFDRDNDLY